jgi:hypothetical protein
MNLLKVCPRSAKRKSRSLLLLLPHYVVLVLGMAFCAQALGGQAAYFAGGLFLLHRDNFSTDARRDLGGLGLYAQRGDNPSHVRFHQDELRQIAKPLLAFS